MRTHLAKRQSERWAWDAPAALEGRLPSRPAQTCLRAQCPRSRAPLSAAPTRQEHVFGVLRAANLCKRRDSARLLRVPGAKHDAKSTHRRRSHGGWWRSAGGSFCSAARGGCGQKWAARQQCISQHARAGGRAGVAAESVLHLQRETDAREIPPKLGQNRARTRSAPPERREKRSSSISAAASCAHPGVRVASSSLAQRSTSASPPVCSRGATAPLP